MGVLSLRVPCLGLIEREAKRRTTYLEGSPRHMQVAALCV